MRGSADVLVSCCYEFAEGITAGLDHYMLSLPFSQLEAIHQAQRAGLEISTTLGPEGIAEACEIARARYFLPYAHGFHGLGKDPVSPEQQGRVKESEILTRVAKALRTRNVRTEVVGWKPGDVVQGMSGGSLTIAHPGAR